MQCLALRYEKEEVAFSIDYDAIDRDKKRIFSYIKMEVEEFFF